MKNLNTCFCCGYDLRGSCSPRCSECGFDPSYISNKEALRQSPLYPKLRRRYAIGITALLLAILLNSVLFPVFGVVPGLILLVFSFVGITGKTVLYEKPVRHFLFLYYSRRLIWLGVFITIGTVIRFSFEFVGLNFSSASNPYILMEGVSAYAIWLWIGGMFFSLIMWFRRPSFANLDYELCLHRQFNGQQFLLSICLQTTAIAAAAFCNLFVFIFLYAWTT